MRRQTVSMTIPAEPETLDEMTDAKLRHSYEQSLAGEGRPFEEVFDEPERAWSDAG
jgi:hypothetical protein